ncbi:hypothetical protein ACLOJK_002791 [Asimina triloba]
MGIFTPANLISFSAFNDSLTAMWAHVSGVLLLAAKKRLVHVAMDRSRTAVSGKPRTVGDLLFLLLADLFLSTIMLRGWGLFILCS